ncbi:MAG: cytochrome b N-terminal domain-containing protein [Acidobacteriota bacterium]
MGQGDPDREDGTTGQGRRGGLLGSIWRSVTLGDPAVPRTDVERIRATVHTLFFHLRPVRVPAGALRFTRTLGLGGAAVVLLSALLATGLLSMLVYQPVPGAAWDSVLLLERDVPFGSLVRGIHYWSANLLVVVLLAHAARVFLTGAFHGARQFNWVVGTLLLALVLGNAFTGYLLPWDQLSYWAVTISTAMLAYVPFVGPILERVARGGTDVGPGTLTVFYTIHTSIVPALLLVGTGFHFWRVRKAGGVVLPPRPQDGPEEGARVLFLPNLLTREVVAALVWIAIVVVLGAAVGAPLGERANTGMSPNPAKAPWYFVGVQELLVHLHPLFAVVVLPLCAVLGFVLLPYLTADGEPEGAWFLSGRGRRTAAIAFATALLATPLVVFAHGAMPLARAGARSWLMGGLLPTATLLGFVWAFALFVRHVWKTSRNETVQVVVVLLGVIFAVLTLIGFTFRGEGMALTWPWGP